MKKRRMIPRSSSRRLTALNTVSSSDWSSRLYSFGAVTAGGDAAAARRTVAAGRDATVVAARAAVATVAAGAVAARVEAPRGRGRCAGPLPVVSRGSSVSCHVTCALVPRSSRGHRDRCACCASRGRRHRHRDDSRTRRRRSCWLVRALRARAGNAILTGGRTPSAGRGCRSGPGGRIWRGVRAEAKGREDAAAGAMAGEMDGRWTWTWTWTWTYRSNS